MTVVDVRSYSRYSGRIFDDSEIGMPSGSSALKDRVLVLVIGERVQERNGDRFDVVRDRGRRIRFWRCAVSSGVSIDPS